MVCQHSWNDETVSNALDGFCYLIDLLIQPNAYGGHVGLWVFKLQLGKCTHRPTRWNYCCRKYGDGHLNQVSIQKNWKVMANLWFSSSYIWRPCWFSIFGGRWEYFTILFEIMTDDNVGIDIKTKSLDSLIRQIFVIEWFHLISMIIRLITQNSMDTKFIWDPYCWNCWHRHKNEVSGKLNTKYIRDWVISPN